LATKKKKSIEKNNKVMYVGIALFVIGSVYLGNILYSSTLQNTRFEEGVKIADVQVGGKTQEEADAILSEKIKDYEKEKLKFIGGGRKYMLSPVEIGVTFDVGKTVKNALKESSAGENTSFSFVVSLNKEKLSSKLKIIEKGVDVKPKNASLGMSGGKVVVLSPSVTGRKVIKEQLDLKVETALEKLTSDIDIPIKKVTAGVNEKNYNNLGLKERISRGQTNFSGSPDNRRHNVATGASKFDGVLIKPGENFSFNTALGPVEKSTGYLPELVILEDKTVPQYGGGLCQVSSTAFRAALNAGLPILYRVAHAYPVMYYKPYGVDATVYLPNPDLIFKNDTKGYILVQTYIYGNELYFDFYGTKKNINVKFAGNKEGTLGASTYVEGITPGISEKGKRGKDSFTAVFYRFIYDKKGKLLTEDHWVSKYDSPKKYPH